MTELLTAEQKFLDLKSDLQTAREAEANKRRDVAALNQRKQGLNADLAGLNKRMAQSGLAIANGDMTSDDYIALKRSIAEKELESEAIGEVLDAQNDILQSLIGNAQSAAERLYRQVSVAAGEVKQRALSAGVAGGAKHLKVFALAVAAEHLHKHPFHGQDKTDQAQLGYRIIGEELCKAVFADESEAWLFMVEPSRAKSAIEAMIGQAA